MNIFHWSIGGAILYFLMRPTKSINNSEGLSYLNQSGIPRGQRNNNPGNLKISSNAWQGKIPKSQNTDGTFEQFTLYIYGVRAMTILIRNYMTRYGLNTIEGIVKRYAPATENHTDKYIAFIATKMKVSKDTQLNTDKTTLRQLVRWMAVMENGKDIITDRQFNAAWALIS